MYCTRCGSQNPDDGSFCRQCGAPLIPASPPVPGAATASGGATATGGSPATGDSRAGVIIATRQTNGLAVASLVMGILGFMTGFTAILAIIFGGIAINQIGKDARMEGKGMAVAGLVMGIVVVVFGLLVVALVVLVSLTSFETGSLTGA